MIAERSGNLASELYRYIISSVGAMLTGQLCGIGEISLKYNPGNDATWIGYEITLI